MSIKLSSNKRVVLALSVLLSYLILDFFAIWQIFSEEYLLYSQTLFFVVALAFLGTGFREWLKLESFDRRYRVQIFFQVLCSHLWKGPCAALVILLAYFFFYSVNFNFETFDLLGNYQFLIYWSSGVLLFLSWLSLYFVLYARFFEHLRRMSSKQSRFIYSFVFYFCSLLYLVKSLGLMGQQVSMLNTLCFCFVLAFLYLVIAQKRRLLAREGYEVLVEFYLKNYSFLAGLGFFLFFVFVFSFGMRIFGSLLRHFFIVHLPYSLMDWMFDGGVFTHLYWLSYLTLSLAILMLRLIFVKRF